MSNLIVLESDEVVTNHALPAFVVDVLAKVLGEQPCPTGDTIFGKDPVGGAEVAGKHTLYYVKNASASL